MTYATIYIYIYHDIPILVGDIPVMEDARTTHVAPGSNLEPNTVYEGAPAAARDVESGSGRCRDGEKRKPGMVWVNND